MKKSQQSLSSTYYYSLIAKIQTVTSQSAIPLTQKISTQFGMQYICVILGKKFKLQRTLCWPSYKMPRVLQTEEMWLANVHEMRLVLYEFCLKIIHVVVFESISID